MRGGRMNWLEKEMEPQMHTDRSAPGMHVMGRLAGFTASLGGSAVLSRAAGLT